MCTLTKGLEPLTPTCAKDSRDDPAELAVASFQPLLDAVLRLGPRLYQAHPRAGEVAQRAGLRRRHTTWTEEAVSSELRHPPCLSRIGRMAGPRPPRAGMAPEPLDHAHEDMRDGLPVHARALHRHARAVRCHAPITEGQQLRVEGAKCTPRSRDLARIVAMAQTRGQACLMPIETTTNRVHHLPRGVLLYQVDTARGQTTGLRLQVGYAHA
jgi:hypothetical protein